MAENSFPCPACGGPVEPNPGEKRTACGFCGVSVTVPASFIPKVDSAGVLARVRNALAGGNKIEAVRLYREGMGVGLKEAKDAVDTLDAEYNPRPAPPQKSSEEQVADMLRKAQPIAAGALNTYTWWSVLKRIVPGCLVLLAAVCILSCASFVGFIFLLQMQGG